MKTIKVVAAIIKVNEQILIAQRKKGEFEGMWEFPGGKVEENESNTAALKREIMEELELDINIDRFFMTAEYDYPTFHLSMDCYICSMNSISVTLHDHKEIRWISILSDISQINWIPADIQIIEKLTLEFKRT